MVFDNIFSCHRIFSLSLDPIRNWHLMALICDIAELSQQRLADSMWRYKHVISLVALFVTPACHIFRNQRISH